MKEENRDNTKEFGRFLRKTRKSKGLNLTDLAKRIGLSQGYLSVIELGGKGIPPRETLKKIADGLDFPYIELCEKAGYFENEEDLLNEFKLEFVRVNEKVNSLQRELDNLNQEMKDIPQSSNDEKSYSHFKNKIKSLEKTIAEYLKEQHNIGLKINELEIKLRGSSGINSESKKTEESSFSDLLNFGLASSNRFNEVKNGVVAQNFESFPVNDLQFHLSDPHNKKLYKKVVLSDEDRTNISALIEAYLLRKYVNSEEGEHQEELISMLSTDLEIEDGYRNEDYRKKNKNGLSAF